ncbi:unnamed protein product [Cuscuta campestris]|uniref:Uncharacterized protein n=1 Tax=Cuscuta campestris TaxID=132261 RepID=A0A484KN04_9ASTE|nr:unnamed protein product [Cuscuta campestris]
MRNHTLAVVNLDEEDEVFDHGELQKKKKRRISFPSTSRNANPDNLMQNEPIEEVSAHEQNHQQSDTPQDQGLPSPPSQAQTHDEVSKFMQLYYDWRAWKVGNSADQLLEWDQQLKNEKIIKGCLGLPINYCCEQILDDEWVWQLKTYEDLHLEYLATSSTSKFEADDEDPAVYKPILSKPTEDQTVLTTEAQAEMETTSEDFQVFPETSPAFETVLPETVQENAASPQQEQNQETSEEELQQFLQSQVQEILTTPPCEISKPTEPEIPEKSTENLEKSPLPETTEEEAHEEQAVEVQRSFEEAEEGAQIARLEASEPPIISLLSKSVRNTMMAYASDCHLQFKEATAIKQHISRVTVNLQKQMSLLEMDIRSALAVSSANQVVTQDYLKVLADNQKEAFRLFRHFGTYTGKLKLEVIVQPRSPSQIPKFPIEVIQGELSYIPSHLNMTELILEAQQSNPENSIQHLSNTEFDGTEAVGTIASHFTNDDQTEDRYNNLKRIQEECGVLQGIGEVSGSSKRKKKDTLMDPSSPSPTTMTNGANSMPFSTITDEVSDLVLSSLTTALALWKGIHDLFHDNKHARAMQLEHEFRTTVKGSTSMAAYCQQLQNLADWILCQIFFRFDRLSRFWIANGQILLTLAARPCSPPEPAVNSTAGHTAAAAMVESTAVAAMVMATRDSAEVLDVGKDVVAEIRVVDVKTALGNDKPMTEIPPGTHLTRTPTLAS